MQDDANKLKGTKKISMPTGNAPLVNGVTGANYVDKAGAFIKANGGNGAMICQRTTLTRGDMQPIEADLRKWGAWMAYFKRIGRPRPTRRLIERHDYQMVPAYWPHLFDAEATVAADHVAADNYIAERSHQESQDTRSLDIRRLVVINALGYDPSRKTTKRDYVKPTQADLDNLELKTPVRPVSDQLKEQLRRTGYHFPTGQDELR